MASSRQRESGSILVATLTPELAGAERIIQQILSALGDRFDFTVGFLRKASPGRGTLPWDGPTVGPWRILFGSYDIIHSHLFLPGLLVRIRRLWSKRFRWVHTVHYHNYAAIRWGWIRRWLDHAFVFPATDRLVSVSEAVHLSLPDLPQSTVIENAIDLSPPDGAGRGTARREEGRRIVGTVAMFRPEKGLRDLILAAETLKDREPEILLRVAGEGPLRGELEGLIEERGLARWVELPGYVDDLAGFYSSLDVYVQPSVEEPFGLAALEAMRFGLPVVASRAGNLPHMLGDGEYGILVNRGGGFSQRLAEGIRAALENPSRYRKRSYAGLAHWQDALDPREMARKYRFVFEDLLRPGICMIASVVTYRVGGLQSQLYLQSRELHRRGYSIFLLQRGDPTLSESDRAGRWKHVRFLCTPDILRDNPGPGTLPERMRGLAFVFFGFLQVFRWRHRIALCHAHQLYSPTLVAALARILLGKPAVVKVTASGALGEAAELERLPFRRLRRGLFRFIDRLIVLTPVMQDEMASFGFREDQIVLVPNCVAVPRGQLSEPSSKEPDHVRGEAPEDQPEPFRVLFAGRLSREKSLHTLIQAVGRLERRGLAVAVDLVGGPDPDRDVTPSLRSEANRLDDPSSVAFHGFRSDLPRFYDRADAFVLPSVSEGMSNALLEAVSYGLVCVASDIPQNRFVIDHGVNGLLFRQGSSEELADRLADLIVDRREDDGALSRRLSEAALETARTHFSCEVVGGSLAELYQEILGRSQSTNQQEER